MSTFDFSPLYRSVVGFDRLLSTLDNPQKNHGASSYPPYNIEKNGDDSYKITVAVAGFAYKDLDVEVRDTQLVISGKGVEDAGGTKYLHRGIGRRAFERRFQLADHVKVKNAALIDGLLVVDLVRELPESMKPRKVQICQASTTIEADRAQAA